jgi:hypothetical protein
MKAAAGRPPGRRRSSHISERVKNPKITLIQCNFHGKSSGNKKNISPLPGIEKRTFSDN